MRVLILWFLITAMLQGDPRILEQKNVAPYACGPCSIINQVLLGTPAERAGYEKIPGKTAAAKAKTIINKYAQRPSLTYGDNKPTMREKGINWADMIHLTNWVRQDVGLPLLKGSYQRRIPPEDGASHVKRVHKTFKDSIDGGVLPIINFISQTAYKDPDSNKWLWGSLMGHLCTLMEVQEELADNEQGFRFRYADSETGKIETGYLHFSEARNFAAYDGDPVKGKWAKHRPFLVVASPTLKMGTGEEDWYKRTKIVLNYAIYLEKEKSFFESE